MKNTLKFGTDGIRGNVNRFPFTNHDLVILGFALGAWAQEKYAGVQQHTPHILIGLDTRASGNRIKNALIQGLSAHDINVTDAGVLPTPALLQLIQKNKKFSCGIVISASHNAYYDNGIKLFDSTTGKVSSDDEKRIEYFFESVSTQMVRPFDTIRLRFQLRRITQGERLRVENLFYQSKKTEGRLLPSEVEGSPRAV